jgi:hypothetical protein
MVAGVLAYRYQLLNNCHLANPPWLIEQYYANYDRGCLFQFLLCLPFLLRRSGKIAATTKL